MTDGDVVFTAKASKELTILRSRHRSSTNHGGDMRTNIVAEKRTKSVADYMDTPDVFVILSHFMISCPYGTGTHHD